MNNANGNCAVFTKLNSYFQYLELIICINRQIKTPDTVWGAKIEMINKEFPLDPPYEQVLVTDNGMVGKFQDCLLFQYFTVNP